MSLAPSAKRHVELALLVKPQLVVERAGQQGKKHQWIVAFIVSRPHAEIGFLVLTVFVVKPLHWPQAKFLKGGTQLFHNRRRLGAMEIAVHFDQRSFLVIGPNCGIRSVNCHVQTTTEKVYQTLSLWKQVQ